MRPIFLLLFLLTICEKRFDMRRKISPSDNSPRKLYRDEALLWQKVKRTVKSSRTVKENFDELPEEFTPVKSLQSRSLIKQAVQKNGSQMPDYSPPVSQTRSVTKVKSTSIRQMEIDDVTVKKIKKGRILIDDRIDLHGMTQTRAHAVLFSFIQNAYHASNRMVLVITGKGKLNEGVLRSQVPNWLHDPMISPYVSGFRQSGISHGGSGALYVRIRKNRAI